MFARPASETGARPKQRAAPPRIFASHEAGLIAFFERIMGARFSLQQIATVDVRNRARKRQVHGTIENTILRCSHAAIARVRVVVVKCRICIRKAKVVGSIPTAGSIHNCHCSNCLSVSGAATDTKTDTNFLLPSEFCATGGYSPTTRQRFGNGFSYLRGCVSTLL